jgi:bifunctional non-homologous end joining protein LigD
MATLQTYREKRNFSKTREPRGGRSRTSGSRFVIQKHDATRLHYDLRLELDGVLKSWAVTRGPSLVPGQKRLAVHVEDHPLEYGDFEGVIPEGEYGGGAVIVWDRGRWTPLGDAAQSLAKGHLEFELHGEKLNGRWRLVRMAAKPGEKRENWLLIKSEDEAARSRSEPDILEESPNSVKTGREISEVAREEPGWSSKTGRIKRNQAARNATRSVSQAGAHEPIPDPSTIEAAKKCPLPGFVEPMLASAVASPPAGGRWVHEIKFDGYRLQARIEAGRVKLLTRSGLDWTKKFGKEIFDALRDLPVGTALLDGELVVEQHSGASDFSALQADLSEGRSDRFVFYVFDLLYFDGYDLRDASLIARKRLLEKIVGRQSGRIRYSVHFEEDGALVLRHVCRLSLEGVVSKRADARYRSGRAKVWTKAKCAARQEFVIAGYAPSTVSRKAVGSLVLGVYEGDRLRHVGRVGTGFTDSMSRQLFEKLDPMRIASSPFDRRLSAVEARKVRYVRPECVAEVEFRGWTADGLLRHASFRGLREDKPARDIVRENFNTFPSAPKTWKQAVQLTHPDRLYWPEQGVTKQGLADYYAEVWRFAQPFLVRRPLALLRCPNGVEGESFFQKHASKGLNEEIVLVKDPKDPKGEPLITIDDLDGLMGLVQAAALEIHPWGSTVADWERPDMITMDLDPGEGVSWENVIAAAEEIRTRLKDAGLVAFVKTSGGKGLHVVAPLTPRAEWPAVKALTKAIADAMASDTPGRFVSTVTKSQRRGKILVDYLRNQRGATAVAPYSTRARPGAAVSMPLSWDELNAGIGPDYFNVANAPTRLNALSADPWEGFWAAAAPLPEAKSRRGKAA